jgi:hypothetical protein
MVIFGISRVLEACTYILSWDDDKTQDSSPQLFTLTHLSMEWRLLCFACFKYSLPQLSHNSRGERFDDRRTAGRRQQLHTKEEV